MNAKHLQNRMVAESRVTPQLRPAGAESNGILQRNTKRNLDTLQESQGRIFNYNVSPQKAEKHIQSSWIQVKPLPRGENM